MRNNARGTPVFTPNPFGFRYLVGSTLASVDRCICERTSVRNFTARATVHKSDSKLDTWNVQYAVRAYASAVV